MPTMRSHVRALMFAIGALGTTTAIADEPSPWVLGAQLGSARGSAATGAGPAELRGDVSTASYDVTTTVGSKNRMGWRLFTGYRLNNYLALQLGYTDLGKVDSGFGNYPDPIPMLDETHRNSPQSARGWDFGLQLKAPVTERISLSVRGGTYRWKAQQSMANLDGEPDRSRQQDSDAFYGAGAEVSIMTDLSGTLEWVRYEVAGEPISLWTVGVLYRLGEDW